MIRANAVCSAAEPTRGEAKCASGLGQVYGVATRPDDRREETVGVAKSRLNSTSRIEF